jgi:Fe-S-cluster containining protein
MSLNKNECGQFGECLRCGECCSTNPGWFAPGEIEKAAEYLAMDVRDFSKKFLVIDGIQIEGCGKIEVFAPLRLNRLGEPALPPLSRADYFYRYFPGKCIFYKGDTCEIYPYRPIECRNYQCSRMVNDRDDIFMPHEEIAMLWHNLPKGRD